MSQEPRSAGESEAPIWGAEEDDMTQGDLGYGLGGRPGGIYQAEGSHLPTSRKRFSGKPRGPPPFPSQGEEGGGALCQPCRQGSLRDACPRGCGASGLGRQSSSDSNSELSNEELRQRLRETLEEVEILKTELEASQRQLEGKEEALKILQSMAVLGKATSHTQAALQKTMEQKRSLEKEINALQWEIEFDQDRFKNIEESWIQKYDRLNCDNAILKEDLKLKTEEIKMLKSENAALKQHCSEALAVLEMEEQKASRESLCPDQAGVTGVSGLELELLQKSKEEAYIMADAFRIAFEEQLIRKNDQALRWTQMDKMCKKSTRRTNWKHVREDVTGGSPQRAKKTLGQKLLGMLPSERTARTEDPDSSQQVFAMLTDLLNDKEAALAHQRKVSYMLARALEEKHTASREDRESNPSHENFVLTNLWHKTSEFPVIPDSIHPYLQSLHSASCVRSIEQPGTDPNLSRTLRRSRSLPSSLLF